MSKRIRCVLSRSKNAERGGSHSGRLIFAQWRNISDKSGQSQSSGLPGEVEGHIMAQLAAKDQVISLACGRGRFLPGSNQFGRVGIAL